MWPLIGPPVLLLGCPTTAAPPEELSDEPSPTGLPTIPPRGRSTCPRSRPPGESSQARFEALFGP